MWNSICSHACRTQQTVPGVTRAWEELTCENVLRRRGAAVERSDNGNSGCGLRGEENNAVTLVLRRYESIGSIGEEPLQVTETARRGEPEYVRRREKKDTLHPGAGGVTRGHGGGNGRRRAASAAIGMVVSG